MKTCSICGRDYVGFGNNAWPVNDGRCCDECNSHVVIAKRVENLKKRDDWFEAFRACLQDMGGSAYDEDRVLGKYLIGYSPADAAGEEICEDDDEPGDRPGSEVLGECMSHRDDGRGRCIDCGAFLPTADGEYWR